MASTSNQKKRKREASPARELTFKLASHSVAPGQVGPALGAFQSSIISSITSEHNQSVFRLSTHHQIQRSDATEKKPKLLQNPKTPKSSYLQEKRTSWSLRPTKERANASQTQAVDMLLQSTTNAQVKSNCSRRPFPCIS